MINNLCLHTKVTVCILGDRRKIGKKEYVEGQIDYKDATHVYQQAYNILPRVINDTQKVEMRAQSKKDEAENFKYRLY